MSELETWSGVYNVLELPELWFGPYTGGQAYIKELNYDFGQSGTFTEDCTFDGNVSYWTKDRFKPPIPGHDNGMPTINWTGGQHG